MRRFSSFSVGKMLLIGFVLSQSPAAADPPDIVRSYKFLPSLSSLRETGGIAGRDWQFPVFGTYDFLTGFRYEPRIPADAILTRYAQFTNVDAYAAYPTMDPGLSLDIVFNLSGLEGKPIFKGPSGLELFRFEGTAGFSEPHSRVDLLAARMGRWMYLRGATEAPCCDFFEYQLKGIAREMPSADLDEDGTVAAEDLIAWQHAYGTTATGREFLDWQRQVGETAPSLAEFDALMSEALVAMSAASLMSVPEPASVCLLFTLALCSCFNRRNSL